ncbi:TOPRIM domain-containing protein [Sulfobacillus acidophilus DSM 10332]|uniref:TOPRIM domain-containing protein n=1 Tax=Sulfobacillus acidophilus (strain ATCC 700253 / DSM 10332 / NAL) TaxID=679936 RepID=G8TSD3_SULAD|nr:TOPRIM domain-containing protein [Sulfobacillus acidophilus DSM 10332]MCY0864303.1 toprim domain-containing protein [Sulfobacillus sp.]
MDDFLIIVEGKNDVRRLRSVVPDTIPIAMTYGIPGSERIEALKKMARHRTVVLMTDADAAGRRIRRMLKEVFPDALDIYTKPGYNGVEHTPLDYMADRLRRVGILPPVPEHW